MYMYMYMYMYLYTYMYMYMYMYLYTYMYRSHLDCVLWPEKPICLNHQTPHLHSTPTLQKYCNHPKSHLYSNVQPYHLGNKNNYLSAILDFQFVLRQISFESLILCKLHTSYVYLRAGFKKNQYWISVQIYTNLVYI